MAPLISQEEAEHEFSALNTLLMVIVLSLCILSSYLIKENKIYFIPESAAAIFVGLIVGFLSRVIYPSEEELKFLTFEPEMFFFLLLPPIIFEAGYGLEEKEFFRNFWTISLFAFPGTVISAFLIGFLVYISSVAGFVESFTIMEALLFGSLISAVDPVATLSILGNPEIKCDPLLYNLVFGESVLNDAVAIVLFKTLMTEYNRNEDFSLDSTLARILWNFNIISFGSIFVGASIALGCSYLCKNTKINEHPEIEVTMLMLFAYGSYSLAESLQLSGIMSLFFCGIVLSRFNTSNLSPKTQVTSKSIFKALAMLCDFFVYLYMGMGFWTGQVGNFNFTFILLVMSYCLAARMVSVFPLSWLANMGRRVPLSHNMQVVIWFAGLRGAIAFALSQNMPEENRKLFVSTTLSIVIITTVIGGGLTEPLLSRTGLKGGSNNNDSHGHGNDDDNTAGVIDSSNDRSSSTSAFSSSLHPRLHAFIKNENRISKSFRRFMTKIDVEYMRPTFGGPTGHDHVIDNIRNPLSPSTESDYNRDFNSRSFEASNDYGNDYSYDYDVSGMGIELEGKSFELGNGKEIEIGEYHQFKNLEDEKEIDVHDGSND